MGVNIASGVRSTPPIPKALPRPRDWVHCMASWVQVGVGHDFRTGATGWKWKITSRFGGAGSVPQIGYKGNLHLCPGLDARVGINADYVLPDMQG